MDVREEVDRLRITRPEPWHGTWCATVSTASAETAEMGEHVLGREAAQSLQEPRPQVTLLMVSERGLCPH